MRNYILLIGILVISFGHLAAQKTCYSTTYLRDELQNDPSLSANLARIELFIQKHLTTAASNPTGRIEGVTIRIPVVVHVLYHYPSDNVTDERVIKQIETLNKCYRRLNADSINTPAVFRSRAADCQIEFQLATSDPHQRATSGIVHKYTPIVQWLADDQMKYSAQTGDDAWDP